MNKCLSICFSLGFVLLGTALKAQSIRRFAAPDAEVIQYKKAEWSIYSIGDFHNPYDQKEVSVDMILTSPAGRPIVLPCYYEADNKEGPVWKARFAPAEKGTYTYHFELKANKKSSSSTGGSFVSKSSVSPGFLRKNNDFTFKFDNGKPFRGIGENVAWESRDFEDDKFTYDHLLPTLSSNGANFFRTWMSYWNIPLEWQKVNMTRRYSNSSAYFNPGAIKRMDELVAMTDSLNLYLMLTLEWHGHFMEKGGWKNSPYNSVNGGPADTPADFFTNDAARDRFKNKLRYCVARWGYSTHLAAWEFFNEVDNAAFNEDDHVLIPLNSIAQWHLEMSRYLKDLDPYQHMVTTSISHRDIIGMNTIPYIDFNQKHIYKHSEKIPSIYKDYISNYGKPYVIGEFGYRWEDADPAYATEFNFDFKRGLWYGLFSPTPILPMSWWWELFDDQKMTPYFRAVREISDQMLKSGSGKFEKVAVNAEHLEAYALKCGKVTYIYVLNNTSKMITTDLVIDQSSSNRYHIRHFDPELKKYANMKDQASLAGKLQLKQLSLGAKQQSIFILTAAQ